MTRSFAHPLPFGAEIEDGGAVRFRLWAPACKSVSLVLEDTGETMDMAKTAGGWFALTTDAAAAGTAYRYRVGDGIDVPDPAARCQAADANGPSRVIDPRSYSWRHSQWRGRPWHETVLYELHTGTFTREGTFDGIRKRLDHLYGLGVTAVELMPISDFPGRRNWGYDGVHPFAPDTAYGEPDALKALIDEAHGREMMVFLDVVYNHFGPDGNYLHLYAPSFFTDRHETPWGAAIDFAQPEVRSFFIENALYWLEEYRFDGLRLDAVHAIADDSSKHILTDLADTVRARVDPARHVHLVLENDANQARYLQRNTAGSPRQYVAQWNDDCHHVHHVLLTGESDGYYIDYADSPSDRLVRSLTQGYVYQGDPSAFRNGERRGEPSDHLPPTAFVNFLQNHDQVGNRAFGERITVLSEEAPRSAAAALYLLAPQIPMLFMGEEWAETRPFLYFTDFHDELAAAVREGRRREFSGFPQFTDPAARAQIPDPNAESTYRASYIDWHAPEKEDHQRCLQLYRRLLELRHREIVPRLKPGSIRTAEYLRWGALGLTVTWILADDARLTLMANLGGDEEVGPGVGTGDLLFQTHSGLTNGYKQGMVPGWSVLWLLAVTSPQR